VVSATRWVTEPRWLGRTLACGWKPAAAFVCAAAPAVPLDGAAAGFQPQAKVRPSQRGSVTQRVADTTLTVDYSRPVARGRQLFGTLVPWGRLWNPGADDASTFETSAAITIDGHDLAAGKYSLWAIPQPERWTFIFNREHAVWHTKYPEGKDALRLEIAPRTGSHMETLAFYFPVVDGRKAELVLHWGTVVLPMMVEVQ
jgi:hypothetical protein